MRVRQVFLFDYFAPFDLRTLFRLIFITDVVVCIMLLSYGERGRQRHLIHRFVAARSLHALGCLLIGSRGEIPAWLSINVANVLVYFGFAIELAAIVSLRARSRWLAPALLCAAGAGSIAVNLPGASPGTLVGVAGLTVAALFGPAAVLLGSPRVASRLQRAMAAFCAVVAVSFLMRAYAGFIEGRSVLDKDLAQMFGLIVMYCYAVAGGVGFLLLLKEDDEVSLRRAATTDHLTGILNRRAFFEAARAALAAAARSERPLALLLVDVDHFKRVNDTYGHPTGDRVLQALAAAVGARARRGDIFGRLGGEEFALLLPQAASPRDALAAAERIRLAAREVTVADAPGMSCSISIGCAVALPAGPEDLDRLMRQCDDALYAAKRGGRDRVSVAEPAAAQRDAV